MADWLDRFEEVGWVEIPGFLTEPEAQSIRSDFEQLHMLEGFRQAGIGKQQTQQIDTAQRGDLISWIDPLVALPSTRIYLDKIQRIIEELNRNFYLGIRDYECHYALYPPGSFYKKHVDRHKVGSPRIVSSVLYLNSNWQPGDGGELCIYDENDTPTIIQPLIGTLALFLSEKEHEVLTTQRDRMSITGWMLNEKVF
jgi:SM-20-related protein